MAGGSHEADIHLEGWRKTFNSVTPRGRLHCAYASIAFWATIALTIKFWPSKKQKQIEHK